MSKLPEMAIQTPNGVRYFRDDPSKYEGRLDVAMTPSKFPGVQLHHLKVDNGVVRLLTEDEKKDVIIDMAYQYNPPANPLPPQKLYTEDHRFDDLKANLEYDQECLNKHIGLIEKAMVGVSKAVSALRSEVSADLKRQEFLAKMLVLASVVNFVGFFWVIFR